MMVEMDHIIHLKYQVAEFFVVEERQAEKIKKSKQSVFQLVFQKQGLKQLSHPLRKGAQSCTKLTKDDPIHFLALLQRENRIQIPIEVRQHLKLESGRFLRIKMQQANSWSTFKDEFFAKLSTDGRITVPWEIRWKL